MFERSNEIAAGGVLAARVASVFILSSNPQPSPLNHPCSSVPIRGSVFITLACQSDVALGRCNLSAQNFSAFPPREILVSALRASRAT